MCNLLHSISYSPPVRCREASRVLHMTVQQQISHQPPSGHGHATQPVFGPGPLGLTIEVVELVSEGPLKLTRESGVEAAILKQGYIYVYGSCYVFICSMYTRRRLPIDVKLCLYQPRNMFCTTDDVYLDRESAAWTGSSYSPKGRREIQRCGYVYALYITIEVFTMYARLKAKRTKRKTGKQFTKREIEEGLLSLAARLTTPASPGPLASERLGPACPGISAV